MFAQLKKFILASGVSGNEKGISSVIAADIAPYVDEVYSDAMGNLIAHKRGRRENAKKLMFAAHMDEIGFMVTFIDEKGFLRTTKMGGINYAAAAFSSVVFDNGTVGAIVPDGRTAPKDYRAEVFAPRTPTSSCTVKTKYVSFSQFFIAFAVSKSI